MMHPDRFHHNNHANVNDISAEVFGDVDLITGPNKASFDPIQANEYTVYKKDVSKNSSCLRKTDYLLTITNSKENASVYAF